MAEKYFSEHTGTEIDLDVNEGLENQPKSNPVWTDLKFPATQAKVGVTSKPDFDYTNLGYLMPQNDTTEQLSFIGQMPHEWKLESELRPHIHYIQSAAAQPTFIMNYRIYKNGDSVPTISGLSTADGSKGVFPYTSGNILQIASFPAIDTTGIDAVSAVLDIVIYRDDNDVTGDVLLKEFDIHYQVDQQGSRQEFVK